MRCGCAIPRRRSGRICHLTGDDLPLRRLIAGVIHRQTACILIDPYANAFNDGPADSPWEKDLTTMRRELHERKFEIDSLCYPVRLAHGYWKATGDASVFDDAWLRAMQLTVQTFREQQRKDGQQGPYTFQRVTHVAYDSMPVYGRGQSRTSRGPDPIRVPPVR